MMPKRPIRAALAIAGLIVAPALAFTQTRGAPNVLLIMTDDSGYGVPSTFGGVIPTPALDRIAGTACATFAEGVRKAGFLVPAQTAAEVALQASPPQRRPSLPPRKLHNATGANAPPLLGSRPWTAGKR